MVSIVAGIVRNLHNVWLPCGDPHADVSEILAKPGNLGEDKHSSLLCLIVGSIENKLS